MVVRKKKQYSACCAHVGEECFHIEELQLNTLSQASIYIYMGIGSGDRTLEREFLKNTELFF